MAGRIAYYGNIATQGLVLDLDAAIQGSYPKTGSTWFDISNNGNNGTLTNGPLYTGSDYGAIVFDGTDDYVDCGTANIIPNSWTLTSWIKHSYRVGYGNIIARSAGASLYEQNATLGWATTRSSSFSVGGRLTNGTFYYECTSSVFLNTGSILNIVGTFNEPTTTLTLYINGAPVNTKNTGLSMTTTAPQRIQVGCSDGNTLGNFFSGSIYNTQVYNQSLSQFQVWQNFNAYKSRYEIPDIVTDGLVLNLDAGNPYSYLSGSSGTTWTNTVAASSSISGTLVNGTTYSNGTMVFDGVDDYVNCGNNTSLQITNNLSVFGWVKGGSQDNKDIVSKYRTTSDQRSWTFGTSLNSDGLGTNKLKVVLSSNGTFNSGFLKYYISDLVVFDNNWKYVGFVFQSNLLKLYVNGNEVSTTKIYDATVNTLYNSSADVWIGAMSNPANQYTGNVANTQIYNRALSAAEVQQNFNALRGRYGI